LLDGDRKQIDFNAHNSNVSQQLAAFKWKHSHLLSRLLELLHVVADCVSDWDCVVDCLEQVSALTENDVIDLDTSASSTATAHSQPHRHVHCAMADRAKVIEALERFQGYAAFLSSDALIKLTTSFVALSMNNIAVFSSGLLGDLRSSSGGSEPQSSFSENPSFSLKAVIALTKRNCFRIATIWQMVISHLRMVAASKVLILT
jgi:hypothetical protein